MKDRYIFPLVLLLLIHTVACSTILPSPHPQIIEESPSPTATVPDVTPASTPTQQPVVSPTLRVTSTSRPSPTMTPEIVPPTLTPSPSPTLQQTASLPDGNFILTFGAVDIVGTEAFLFQTSEALALLRDKSPAAYLKVQKYIGLIELGAHSAMWAYENPPRFEVGQRTADSTTTWYASTIAHDATHSEIYHEYLASNGPPVPDEVWISVEVEQFCIAYQLQVLKEIEAPAYEIEYLESQTGDHCDVDNDGDCDWDDYDNRDW